MKKVLIENSKYSILLYILIEKKWQDTILVINSETINLEFINTLKKSFLKVYVMNTMSPISKNKNISFFLKRYIVFLLDLFRLTYIFFENKIIFNKEVVVYGNDNLSYFILRRKKIRLIEDGLVNYYHKQMRKNRVYNILKNIIYLKPPFYKSYGYSKFVEKIYLTNKSNNKDLEKKEKIINLKNLWQQKNQIEKEKILLLYNLEKNYFNKVEKKKVMLLTQPLSEDNLISEKKKIMLYKKIISRYNENDLIIKVHPREKTNYIDFFPKITIIKDKIPFELYYLQGIELEKVVTIFSTAVLVVKEEILVDFFGTEIDDEIFKKVGSLEHIIKRNVFLK